MAVARQQDVGRLHVPVEHLHAVRRGQGFGHLDADAQAVGPGQAALGGQLVGHRATGLEGHHQVRRARPGDAGVEDGHDPGVVRERPHGLALSLEAALGPLVEGAVEDLHRDRPAERGLLGPVDRPEAAASDRGARPEAGDPEVDRGHGRRLGPSPDPVSAAPPDVMDSGRGLSDGAARTGRGGAAASEWATSWRPPCRPAAGPRRLLPAASGRRRRFLVRRQQELVPARGGGGPGPGPGGWVPGLQRRRGECGRDLPRAGRLPGRRPLHRRRVHLGGLGGR